MRCLFNTRRSIIHWSKDSEIPTEISKNEAAIGEGLERQPEIPVGLGSWYQGAESPDFETHRSGDIRVIFAVKSQVHRPAKQNLARPLGAHLLFINGDASKEAGLSNSEKVRFSSNFKIFK